MIRMIGLDLDGTLLTRNKRLTEENRAAEDFERSVICNG